MLWLEAADRGTSWTPWHRGPPFLVASGALRSTSHDSASVAAELFSMCWMERLAGGVTRQNLSESCIACLLVLAQLLLAFTGTLSSLQPRSE